MIGRSVISCVLVASAAHAADLLKFERQRIGDATFEAASVCDVNRDGKPDIVSGEYWFEGPAFTKQHKICDLMQVEDYYDDFSDFPMDVNGDDYPDIISGGWWGQTLIWRENPKGRDIPWKTHDIDKCGPIETSRFWDVDGDGQLEIVPNAGGRVAWYKLVRDADGRGTGRFEKHVVKPDGCGHGLGFGDVNGDGRDDFVVPDGWIEAPVDRVNGQWTWHPDFKLGSASVPILVHDVNADGLADLIVGMAHDYGLAWYEQGRGTDGRATWTKHDIDPDRSQYHDMMLVDIDNDGKPELLTGKRYRAHQEHDPGSLDPIGLYYFKIEGGRFTRYTIDYGPACRTSGAGIYFWVTDLDGNGWPDIVAPGKQGLYLFRNHGPLNSR
ncbi:MAG: FG-GAP repeat domain-containing protein [Phycisphaerae bacterium]